MDSSNKGILSFLKGSFKDPLFCLALISIILVTLALISARFIPAAPQEKGDFSSLKEVFFQKESPKTFQEAFLGLVRKTWPESPELLLVENCSLKAVSTPCDFSPQVLGALVEGYEPEDTKKVITEYIVEQGETIAQIAQKFEVSVDTVLWANDLTKNSKLKAGQQIIILPVSGLLHHVKSGDVVSAIAEKYKAKGEEIIAFNNLSDEGDIYVGDIVVVPNGTMPPPSVKPVITIPQIPLANSYFICPVSSPCRLTQGLHWYNAIDFSHGKCGELIYSAAAGEVLKVKLTESTSRWAFSGAGNHITILHPNGVVTMYGHIAASLVKQGDQVSQGQVIALMGGQPGMPGAGMSTGCHLHFGVSGAKNPFSR